MSRTFGYQIRTDHASGMAINDVIDNAFADFSQPAHVSFNSTDILCGFGATAAIGLTWVYHFAGKMTRRDREEHGSARWGKPADFKPFQAKDNNALLVTQAHHLNLNSYITQRNLNLLCIGGSGAWVHGSKNKATKFAA